MNGLTEENTYQPFFSGTELQQVFVHSLRMFIISLSSYLFISLAMVS